MEDSDPKNDGNYAYNEQEFDDGEFNQRVMIDERDYRTLEGFKDLKRLENIQDLNLNVSIGSNKSKKDGGATSWN